MNFGQRRKIPDIKTSSLFKTKPHRKTTMWIEIQTLTGRSTIWNLSTPLVTSAKFSLKSNIRRQQVNCLDGVVVKASASRAEDPGFESHLRRDFSGSSHTSDSRIGTPVATLPGAWRYRVSTGTGWPGVSILWLGKVESLFCNFCLSVAARKIVCADPSLRYTSLFLGR